VSSYSLKNMISTMSIAIYLKSLYQEFIKKMS